MKKKIVLIMLVALMGLTGCQNKEKEENQEAYRQIGINCMAEGDYNGAIDAFQNALGLSLAKISDKELDICYYKAEAQYKAGKVDDAISTYSALLDYNKKNSDAYYLRGSLYLVEKKKDDAFKDFENAVKYSSDNYEMYVEISNQLAAAGETDKSKNYLKQALDISGKSAEDYTWRGRIYLMMKDYDKAKEQFDEAVKKDSTDVQLYLGQLYEAQGDNDKAQTAYESYAKNNSDNPKVLESLASLATAKKDYGKAVDYLTMALKTKEPENEQNLRQDLILAYENNGDFAAAKEQMETYLKKYPNDEKAKRENTFLQTR